VIPRKKEAEMPATPPSREAARGAVASLVERYSRNRDRYQTSNYNEETCRAEFITPLFEAFGWDVTNRAGYAEQYKDVIHEEGIKVGDYTKAPDYTFRVAGVRKFFVEAKKPFVDLKTDPAPAYQLRRYAWSAKLPLSILTDFEELAVYDTRVRPRENDKPAVARILYVSYDELLERFDELWDIFSKEAVLKGSFDRYAEEKKGKRGTAEVDAEFLKEIEGWREELARNLALRNADLSVDELNFAVQTTIDRIIFLRIAEGRGAEPYGSLLGLVNGADIHKRLIALYRKADTRYNSGLFDFKADRLTPHLAIDDKVLKPILLNLYYPQSPYEFSVLPAEILGNVYEQFLGKVITLSKGHRATIEEKPEVKKAGGVFYTPGYIVDYIVRQTVGALCEGKSPKQMEKLRILDPACGSGSFLIRAYQELLDRHLSWYREHEPAKHRKEVFLGPGGDWRLTTAEKRRIVLNNIYGVDIDRQAVEVTKLSLLLKVLEGENDETLTQQSLFGERALPSLEGNIKCGNSLIAPPDLGELIPDPSALRRMNPFSWKSEFPTVFSDGGFDAVIGNPPYIRIQTMQEWAPEEVALYKGLYRSAASGNYDIYVVFVERGLSLLGAKGRLGYILPNKFFRTDYGEGIRGLLSGLRAVQRIVDFGHDQVFSATTYTCLLLLDKQGDATFDYAVSSASSPALNAASFSKLPATRLTSESWTFRGKEEDVLFSKLSANAVRLLDLPADMSRGSSTGDDEVFVVDVSDAHRFERGILRTPLFASDFGRFRFRPSDKWRIIYPYVQDGAHYRTYEEHELRTRFPKAYAYLQEHQQRLKRRKQFRQWYAFSAPRNLALHESAQIAVPLLADRGLFALVPSDARGRLCPMASGGFTISLSPGCAVAPEYVLGLLNSKLLFWCLSAKSNVFRGGWITCTKQYFGELPIRRLDLKKKVDQEAHSRVVDTVNLILALKTAHAAARTPQELTTLQRQIAAAESRLNKLVYELYELTPVEIAVVEAATASA